MQYLHTLLNRRLFSGLLACAAIVGPSHAALAQAPVFVPTPPDQGTPTGRRQGGATRGECSDYQGLTALVPQVEGIVWSHTASATPAFFFYVPHTLNSEILLEFVIQDSRDNYAFYEEFAVDAEAGILAVQSEPDADLNADEAYLWTFSIYCDAARPSASVSVSGTVKRVTDTVLLDANPEPTPATQFDQIRQYAASGIWHEAIAGAIALYQADPNNADYQATLEALLEQSGLADIAPAAPVYECCEEP